MDIWQHIYADIAAHTGKAFHPPNAADHRKAIGGGCINQAVQLSDGQQQWFVKLNDASRAAMFEAEAEGLNAIADSRTISVPRPLCTGQHDGHSYIVIEYIQTGRSRPTSQALAGERLAAMHRQQQTRFGWHRDNTIGATHQANAWHDDWIDFWREQRLGFQLRLASTNGHGGRLQHSGARLLERLPVLLDHQPSASLLHGDLWGGNITFDQDGQPVIFDPAVYYGDREADLAMTELFGGFDDAFYAAYRSAWSLDPGYRVRKTLYNLYHILNHLNLFGSGYASQAQRMIDQLLAEC